MRADERFFVVGKFPTSVTETDRALVKRNAFSDLAAVEPPAPGPKADPGEIDVVAVDRESGELLLLDVKRGSKLASATA